jgi:hypothetical protein
MLPLRYRPQGSPRHDDRQSGSGGAHIVRSGTGGADRGGGGRFRGSKSEVKGTLPVQATLSHN